MKKLNAFLATAMFALSGAVGAANVLVVLSDADHLDLKDGKVYPTGFYLNELAQPVKLLLDAGHDITFSTPKGQVPVIDKNSLDPMYFGGDAAMKESLALLEKLGVTSRERSPVISLARVEQAGYARYDAVFVPGGHAPMQDLIRSPELGRLLTSFHERGKPTALVCHGPAALLSALNNPAAVVGRMEAGKKPGHARWIYAGYRMTVISNQEEAQAASALNGGVMKLLPQKALQLAGANYSSNTSPWAAHVVTDRELITGQNPASAMRVGQELVARLKK